MNLSFFSKEQIKSEVLGALDFMRFVYTIFGIHTFIHTYIHTHIVSEYLTIYRLSGMSYKLELSTRPEKALGDPHLWYVCMYVCIYVYVCMRLVGWMLILAAQLSVINFFHVYIMLIAYM